MSFAVLLNSLSLFIAISFLPELLLISKIDLDKQERTTMKFIIIASGVTTLFVAARRFIWGENRIYEPIIALTTMGILVIWFFLVFCVYNYCLKKIRWKRNINEDGEDTDYFKKI